MRADAAGMPALACCALGCRKKHPFCGVSAAPPLSEGVCTLLSEMGL